MKVQIEIPQKVINIAIAQLSMNAKDENDLQMIDQAVERCTLIPLNNQRLKTRDDDL